MNKFEIPERIDQTYNEDKLRHLTEAINSV